MPRAALTMQYPVVALAIPPIAISVNGTRQLAFRLSNAQTPAAMPMVIRICRSLSPTLHSMALLP
jgi:hypothetical protein